MSFFFTKVPTQWSPTTTVTLLGGITLKPANRVKLRNYPGSGATTYFDTLYFISQARSVEEHIEKLKRWTLFHAIIIDEHICHFIENGRLKKHQQANRIGNIRKRGSANAYAVNFTDVARQVYWLHEPATAIDYRTSLNNLKHLTMRISAYYKHTFCILNKEALRISNIPCLTKAEPTGKLLYMLLF